MNSSGSVVRQGAKRARAAPTFTDEQEISIIEFVKESP